MNNLTEIIEAVINNRDETNKHAHVQYKFDAIEAYFHNFAMHDIPNSPDQTPGYQHCARSGETEYQVKHIGEKHGISSEYALGHGPKEVQWFRFTKKINKEWYDLSSGIKVDKKGD